MASAFALAACINFCSFLIARGSGGNDGLRPRTICQVRGGSQEGSRAGRDAESDSGFNESVVTGVTDERVNDACLHIIGRITAICERMLGRTVPIVIHGYGLLFVHHSGRRWCSRQPGDRCPVHGCGLVSSKRASTT